MWLKLHSQQYLKHAKYDTGKCCFHIFSPLRVQLKKSAPRISQPWPGLCVFVQVRARPPCLCVSVHVFTRGLSCKRSLIRIGWALVFWVFSALTQADLLWDKLSQIRNGGLLFTKIYSTIQFIHQRAKASYFPLCCVSRIWDQLQLEIFN